MYFDLYETYAYFLTFGDERIDPGKSSCPRIGFSRDDVR